MNVLLALSGGIASTVLLARLFGLNFNVATIGFHYNSPNNDMQNAAAINIAKHYNVPFTLVDVSSPMSGFQLEIPRSNKKVKKSRTSDMLFISILAGIAEFSNFDTLSLGSQTWNQAFTSAMDLSTLFASNKKMGLYVPFAGIRKMEILHEGISHEVPYELTRTCFTHMKIACGSCEDCVERLSLFKSTIMKDPLEYTTNVI